MTKRPPFRMSANIAVHSKNWKNAIHFYRDVMGLDVKKTQTHLEVQNGPIFTYVQNNPGVDGNVMEYYVDDVEKALDYLEKQGCTVLKWDGKGKDCYMKDPFGLQFNLWEEK